MSKLTQFLRNTYQKQKAIILLASHEFFKTRWSVNSINNIHSPLLFIINLLFIAEFVINSNSRSRGIPIIYLLEQKKELHYINFCYIIYIFWSVEKIEVQMVNKVLLMQSMWSIKQ